MDQRINDLEFSGLGLGDFLVAVTDGIAREQTRIDEDYLQQLSSFVQILEIAKASGYAELALEVVPKLMVIDKTEIEASFKMVATRSEEFDLAARAINLAYSRRYKYSEFVRNNLKVTVQRTPLQPGATTRTDR